MKSAVLFLISVLGTLVVAEETARGNPNRGPNLHWKGRWHLPQLETAVPHRGNTTFSQFIDHNNPSLGTFEQWFVYDTTFYNGPGSPVILFTPGEVNASAYTGYLTNATTVGTVAQKVGGAAILLEHRYWGTSTPFTELTTANLTYLTLENSIRDLTNFANNVKLPFDPSGQTNAKNAPWVMIGGSYSGALAAWTESVDPGTYWAYHCSSGPTQAISDYWGYFLPVQEGMPKNCSKDVGLVIEHMDNILETGTDQEIHDLKAMFGLETVEHNDDFMSVLETGPFLWQGNQFFTTSGFFIWCDYIENAVRQKDPTKIPGEEGVGLEKALQGYADFVHDFFFPNPCAGYGYFGNGNNTECFNSYNASSGIFTDTSLSNIADRQWEWMLCNTPFGYWQDGAPTDRPTIVSRLITPEYWARQCNLYFPPGPNGETFGLQRGKSEADTNTFTGGWDITNSTRLQYTNGDFDPWREGSVSSELRPSGPLQSTPQVPVHVIPGGFHTSDLLIENGDVNDGAKTVIDAEIEQLVQWVNEWPGQRGSRWQV